ncbi:MAG: 2-succinyl-5-enolpyruvyl-6-hydroxy-3-cyclohexene-1-carboxylic-acid synthase [Chlamydiales bacterium]
MLPTKNLPNALITCLVKRLILHNIKIFCIAPGIRNAPLIQELEECSSAVCHYFNDERSAGFFALGKSRSCNAPVCIVTTSGTASGELLAAFMEAYYTHTPLLAITCDRPKRFKDSNAPQTAEQVHLYGHYTPFFRDIESIENFELSEWSQHQPAHLNLRLEDPMNPTILEKKRPQSKNSLHFSEFIKTSKFPFIIVSEIPFEWKERIIRLLITLNAPTYLESTSLIRENPMLESFRIKCIDGIMERAKSNGYPIDGVLRIGGIPTTRFWRDLENLSDIYVCSISHRNYSGLSWGKCAESWEQVEHEIPRFFRFDPSSFLEWKNHDAQLHFKMTKIFKDELHSEPSLIHSLSSLLPHGSHIFLGNSQPIRYWDLAASYDFKNFQITASRGLNGIDGQLSTFFGLCESNSHNIAILGDLTLMHDMGAFWIHPQISCPFHIFVINNGGGGIFRHRYPLKSLQNSHSWDFSSLATMWQIPYARYRGNIPKFSELPPKALIELIPDLQATDKLWKTYQQLCLNIPCMLSTVS